MRGRVRTPAGPAGLAVAMVAAALAGCVGGAEDPHPATTPASVALKWTHQAQFAGIYLASSTGLYAKRGLEMTLIEGGPKVDTVKMVDEGASEFGITSVAQLLKARARGSDAVAIAAVYQKSPVGFFALRETGITTPQEIVGKRVAYSPTHEPFLVAMFERLGLDLSTIQRVEFSTNLSHWYRGDADVWAGYVMNQPVDARLAGYEVNIVFPDDWGVHMYDDVIVTSGKLARERPERVAAFLAATLDGWHRAIERPEQAIAVTLAAKPELREEKERLFLLASAPLIQTGVRPIGWMEAATWESAYDILRSQGLLDKDLHVPSAYTTQFLDEHYRGR